MQIHQSFRLLLATSLALTLAACGSGAPGNPGPQNPGGGDSGGITVENADLLPYGDRLVFNQIGSRTYKLIDNTVVTLDVHDRTALKVRNFGTSPLDIGALTITGPWQLESAPALPLRLAAGESRELKIRFNASGPATPAANCVEYASEAPSVGTYKKCTFDGKLTISAGAANKTVQLAGFWQPFPEGDHEPSLQQIVDLFGYKTVLGTSANRSRPYGNGDPSKPFGEEIISAYWQRADTGKAVTVQTLAMFHGRNGDGSLQPQRFYWFNKGDAVAGEQQLDSRTQQPKPTISKQIMEQAAEGAQMFRPQKRGGADYALQGFADVSFTPAGAFGLCVQDEYSVPSLNTETNRPGATLCNKFSAGSLQVRFWPLRDRENKVVANTYIVGMDAYCDNYDYNDNVYIISNIRPAQ